MAFLLSFWLSHMYIKNAEEKKHFCNFQYTSDLVFKY